MQCVLIMPFRHVYHQWASEIRTRCYCMGWLLHGWEMFSGCGCCFSLLWEYSGCWSWVAPACGALGRLTRIGSYCHQLPAMAMGPWVPQTFQALIAYLQTMMRLAGKNVNFSWHLLHSRECIYFRITMCLSF